MYRPEIIGNIESILDEAYKANKSEDTAWILLKVNQLNSELVELLHAQHKKSIYKMRQNDGQGRGF